MKALIRNPGETIISTSNVSGIDWETGAPLTNPDWCDGPYHLVEVTEEQLRILRGEIEE